MPHSYQSLLGKCEFEEIPIFKKSLLKTHTNTRTRKIKQIARIKQILVEDDQPTSLLTSVFKRGHSGLQVQGILGYVDYVHREAMAGQRTHSTHSTTHQQNNHHSLPTQSTPHTHHSYVLACGGGEKENLTESNFISIE